MRRGAATHPGERLAGNCARLPVVFRTHVRQFMPLPVGLDVFDRI